MFDRAADDEFDGAWLTSGNGILFQSVDGSVHREWVADLAAGSAARDLGVLGSDYVSYLISPDGGQVVLAVPTAASDKPTYSVVDLATLAATPLNSASGDIVWQRTAD